MISTPAAMKKLSFYITILSFLLSYTVVFAQHSDRIKTNITDQNGRKTKPLKKHNEYNFTEKLSDAKAVLDLNTVVKIKSSHDSGKIKQPFIDNSKSAKGIETILFEGFELAFPGTVWDVYASFLSTDAYWDDTNYTKYTGAWSGWCANGGTQSVVPGMTYPVNMVAWMIFGPFDLSDATSATLSFKNWLDTELDFDYLRYMASINGTNFYGGEASGNSAGWVSRSLDLKNVPVLGDLTGEPEVWIAFQFTSDEAVNKLGAYIDDIVIEKTVLPDLKWTNYGLTTDALLVGSTVTAELTETNTGVIAGGAHASRLYISPDNIITSSDIQLGTDLSYTTINPGATQLQSKSFTVPDIIDGTYYVGAITDFYNAVAESDEINNTNYRTGKVTVFHCPPPAIGTITQPTCASSTGSVVLNGLPSTGTWTLTRNPGGITTTGTGTSTTITGIAPGTYTFTVKNAANYTSPASAGVIINPQPSLPAAPVSNTATGLSLAAFTANWTSTSNASGYKLDVATDNGFTSFVTGYNNKDVGNVLTFNVTGLNANTAYYYRVKAYSSCGSSSNSGTITATTLQNPPSAPVANQATSVLQTTFTANWVSSSAATGYRLDVATNAEFTSFVTGFNDKDVGNVIVYSITGLSPSTTYQYRVRAYSASGTSLNSNIISVTTLSNVPAAPGISLASEILQTSFSLTWNSVATATGYKLDVSTNNAFTSFVSGYNDKDVGNVTTLSVTGLIPKTTYYSRVKAYSTAGTSPNSNIKTVTTLTLPPPVPSGVTSSSCNDLVTLKWRNNTGADFLRYRIYGGTSANPTTKIDSSSTSSSDTMKIFPGLTRGQTYYFRVTAVNYDGVQSDFSEQASTIVKTGVIPKIKVKWNSLLICYNLSDSIKSYQWFNGDAAISGETKQFFETNKRPGVYRVETIDQAGCRNSSAGVPVSGISSINLYPNPSPGSFALTMNSLPEGRARITIINPAGLTVMDFEAELTENTLFKEIHLNNFDEGIYIVKVLINKDSYYSRIVIAK